MQRQVMSKRYAYNVLPSKLVNNRIIAITQTYQKEVMFVAYKLFRMSLFRKQLANEQCAHPLLVPYLRLPHHWDAE